MALHIEFTRKSNTSSNKNEDTSTPLATIDEEICSLLGIEEDIHSYAFNWLSFIDQEVSIEGYELGSAALRDKVISWDIPELVIIHDYLVENYTARTWCK